MKILRKKLSLSYSAASVYAHLCDQGQKPNTALFETCEVARPEHAHSFTFCSAAVSIYGRDKKVVIEALNSNGVELLQVLELNFVGYECADNQHKNRIELMRQPLLEQRDESLRLKQPSVLSVVNAVREQIATMADKEKLKLSDIVFFGSISFDLVDQFESLPELNKQDDDLVFYLADQYLVQDHHLHSAKIITMQFGENASASAQQTLQRLISEVENIQDLPELSLTNQHQKNSTVNISDDEFCEHVKQAKQHILAGEVFQVVLSRKFSLPCHNAFHAYQVLRESNPSPYLFYLNFGEQQLFGASPESALKVSENRNVTLYPIAGTRPRGGNAEHDARIEYELIQDQKETAEHMMLVDLARNDIARIAEPGTRAVTQLKNVVKYSKVMHIVSEVEATLNSGIDSLSAYRACANMGTLTGAPKIQAMKIIRQQERAARGWYGGAVCVYFGDDRFDSAIVIRSAVVNKGIATVTAGAGIVYDSEPQSEADETSAKASAVLSAIELSNTQVKP